MSEEFQGQQPTKEHARLKELEGTWKVACTYFMDPSQPPMETEATDTAKMLGNFWLEGRFKTEMFGAPFEGLCTTGFNPATQKWESTWIDTMSPFLFHFTGDYDEANKVLTMSGPGPHPATGEMVEYRTVDKQLSPNERHFEMFCSTPEGEMQMFKYVYTRS